MGAHVPHMVVAGPWSDGPLPISDAHAHHLIRVLRVNEGDPVSYTDGMGTIGEGTLSNGAIVRGLERLMERPIDVTIAVAPIKSNDRMRFMIEKLQELGIRSLVWLTCDHNQARPPSSNKIEAWVAAALEQSRGAWKLEVGGPVRLADLDAPVVLDPAGEPLSAGTALVCVGPEGGWSSAERDAAVTLGSLGDTILRTETAAIVAAARLTTHR